MTSTAKRLINGATLTGAAVRLYTAVGTVVVKVVNISNPTGGALSATVYLVSAGAAPAPANMVLPPAAIAAGGTLAPVGVVNQVLENGGEIWATGGAGLTVQASGIVLT